MINNKNKIHDVPRIVFRYERYSIYNEPCGLEDLNQWKICGVKEIAVLNVSEVRELLIKAQLLEKLVVNEAPKGSSI